MTNGLRYLCVYWVPWVQLARYTVHNVFHLLFFLIRPCATPIMHATLNQVPSGRTACTEAWSVCLCVRHTGELCKNGWTDRHAVWGPTQVGQKNHWGRDPHAKGQFWGLFGPSKSVESLLRCMQEKGSFNPQLEGCIVLNEHSIRLNRSAICNRYFLKFSGHTRVLDANGVSIASVVFGGLTAWQTDWQTGRPRYSVGNNRRSTQRRSQIMLLSTATTSIYWSSRLDRSDQLQQSAAILSCQTRLDGLQCMWRHVHVKGAFLTGVPEVTQLFTYLLTYKLFSSCIRRYLVSRARDWVMPALSAVLLTFSFQFNLLFCALTQFCVILFDDLAMIWRRNQASLCKYVMPYRKRTRALILARNVFLYAAYIPEERLWIDSNFKNRN